MTFEHGLTPYNLFPSIAFLSQIRHLIKRRYKKNPQGEEQFREVMKSWLVKIQEDPRGFFSAPEPFPSISHQPPLELRKVRFNMPTLSGGSGQGRIIYLIHPDDRWVWPIIIYTHAEHPGRPPDDDLSGLIKDALDTIANADKASKGPSHRQDGNKETESGTSSEESKQ